MSETFESKPLPGLAQSMPYKLMHTAMELHERGLSPPELYVNQERIREEPDVMRAIQHYRVADALTGGSFGNWVLRGKHWMLGSLKKAKDIENNKNISSMQRALLSTSLAFRPFDSYRENYTALTTHSLQWYGADGVSSIIVVRIPIAGMVKKAIHLQDHHMWGGAQGELPYDDLFQLFLRLEMRSGQVLVIEKLPVINISKGSESKLTDRSGNEVVIPITRASTLLAMMNSTRMLLGDQAFFSYNAVNNNDQVFVNAFLVSNERQGVLQYTTEAKKLVATPAQELCERQKAFSDTMRSDFHSRYVLSSHRIRERKRTKKRVAAGDLTENMPAQDTENGNGVLPSVGQESEIVADDDVPEDYAPSGIGGAFHLDGLRDSVSQPLSEDEPSITAHINDVYPLTSLMSGTSDERLGSLNSLTPASMSILHQSFNHIASNPSVEVEHPLVTPEHVDYMAQAPDTEALKDRMRIVQAESGHGLLNDMKLSSGDVLPSWTNSNILNPIHNTITAPASESIANAEAGINSVTTPTINSIVNSLPNGGISESNGITDTNPNEAGGDFGDILGHVFSGLALGALL